MGVEAAQAHEEDLALGAKLLRDRDQAGDDAQLIRERVARRKVVDGRAGGERGADLGLEIERALGDAGMLVLEQMGARRRSSSRAACVMPVAEPNREAALLSSGTGPVVVDAILDRGAAREEDRIAGRVDAGEAGAAVAGLRAGRRSARPSPRSRLPGCRPARSSAGRCARTAWAAAARSCWCSAVLLVGWTRVPTLSTTASRPASKTGMSGASSGASAYWRPPGSAAPGRGWSGRGCRAAMRDRAPQAVVEIVARLVVGDERVRIIVAAEQEDADQGLVVARRRRRGLADRGEVHARRARRRRRGREAAARFRKARRDCSLSSRAPHFCTRYSGEAKVSRIAV